MRLVLLFGIAVVCASLWHYFLPRFWLASVTATITTLVMFGLTMSSGLLKFGPRTLYIQYFALAELLGPDLLGAVAIFDLVTSSLLAFVVSALIGLPFRSQRKRLRKKTQA
jgi:hypothetical protein